MLEIKLRKYDVPSCSAITIVFPASEPDLQKAMDKIGIGITTEKQCLVDAVQNDDGELQDLVGTLVNSDEIQYLAKRMDSFEKFELKTFMQQQSTKSWLKSKISLISLSTFNVIP